MDAPRIVLRGFAIFQRQMMFRTKISELYRILSALAAGRVLQASIEQARLDRLNGREVSMLEDKHDIRVCNEPPARRTNT